jgi:hypothetical protein
MILRKKTGERLVDKGYKYTFVVKKAYGKELRFYLPVRRFQF